MALQGQEGQLLKQRHFRFHTCFSINLKAVAVLPFSSGPQTILLVELFASMEQEVGDISNLLDVKLMRPDWHTSFRAQRLRVFTTAVAVPRPVPDTEGIRHSVC